MRQITNGESNFRRSNDLKHICECFQATEDFRDSRHVAPYTDVIVSFVNSKHHFSLLSISKNYHLQRYNFFSLILVELLEKKLHREFSKVFPFPNLRVPLQAAKFRTTSG